MNQRWGWKKELDDDRERKMKRRKNKKKQKKKNQVMEHSKSSPHDNVIETFLFIFYSSLAYTLCRESKIRDVCAKGWN